MRRPLSHGSSFAGCVVTTRIGRAFQLDRYMHRDGIWQPRPSTAKVLPVGSGVIATDKAMTNRQQAELLRKWHERRTGNPAVLPADVGRVVARAIRELPSTPDPGRLVKR